MSNTPVIVKDAEIMPQHEMGGHEMLRHIRKSPTVIYGIFTEIVRQFYMDAGNHGFGTPTAVWDPDPDKTQIWIDTELEWEDKHPELRPAIYIQLGPITFKSLSGRSDGLMGGRTSNSEQYFTRSGSGTVSFVHIGGTAGEACALADSTMDYLDAFGKVIRDDFCFTSFALTQREARKQMPKESKERYGSVVTCAFETQDRWTLKLESQLLKVLAFRAGQRLLDGGIV